MSAALWRHLAEPEVWEGSERLPVAKLPPVDQRLVEPTPVNDPQEDLPMPTDYVPARLRRYASTR